MNGQLPDGVYVATVRGDLVFLDSRKNEYLCVTNVGTDGSRTSCSKDAAADFEAQLVAAGLLLPAAPGSATQLTGPAATAHDDLFSSGGTPAKPTLNQATRLLRAACSTAVRMALPRPSRWLRKAGASALKRGRQEEAIALAQVFNRLRPWVPRSGRCLPSSILLLEFLRLNGVDGDWVFGVRTCPFEAHCWVEKEGVVLNDSCEHVRWYTPIAVA